MNPITKRRLSVIFAWICLACPATTEAAPPTPILFDTDIDTDCDDVGAVACLHALADAGEIEILATTVSSNYPYSAPCLDALNRFYGRPDLPLGVPKRPAAGIDRGSRYAKPIAERFPSRFATNEDAPPAVDVLRRALADARDDSVRLVTVGYLTNVADLLRSPADDISPLTGAELAEQKVSMFVVMGGRYPEHLNPGTFGNFKPDPESAVDVAENWPGPIHFSGDGEKVGTGKRRTDLSVSHPMRVAYDLFLGEKPTRSSWDQTALLIAARPDARFWKFTRDGGNQVFPNGTNRWVDEDPADHRLVQIVASEREALTDEIERLMVSQDRKQQLAGIRATEEVVYKTVGDVELKLHVFLPLASADVPGGPNATRAAAVFFFGGGWKSGSVTQFYPHCRHLADQGMVGMCADYRVASRHGVKAVSCVEDAKAAMRFVRRHAERWNIDPDRIAAGGGSAGGHLAAAVATVPGFEPVDADVRSRPDALILFNPALVLAPIPGRIDVTSQKATELAARVGADPITISPYHHLDADLPPTIIFHGMADTTVPYPTAEVFARRAEESATKCELVGYEDQSHGFFNFTRGQGRSYDETVDRMDSFLRSLHFLP